MDPRWKLASLLTAALLVASLHSLGPALCGLAGATILVGLAQLPLAWYAVRMGLVALFLAVFLVWLPLLPDAGPRIELGPLSLSQRGLELSAVLLVRALALVTLILVLLATAPVQETLRAAHALYAPGLIVQLALLTHRYVFLLGEEFGRLRTALRVRGYRNRANLHSYRTIGQVTGTLLVRGHERAERVSHAMRCRGFDGVFRSLHSFSTRWQDVLAAIVIVGWAGSLVAWDLWIR
jgi:cobalt/nickel transport system permease protein